MFSLAGIFLHWVTVLFLYLLGTALQTTATDPIIIMLINFRSSPKVSVLLYIKFALIHRGNTNCSVKTRSTEHYVKGNTIFVKSTIWECLPSIDKRMIPQYVMMKSNNQKILTVSAVTLFWITFLLAINSCFPSTREQSFYADVTILAVKMFSYFLTANAEHQSGFSDFKQHFWVKLYFLSRANKTSDVPIVTFFL